MPVDPQFFLASHAAEESLEVLKAADMLIKEGKVDKARTCLKGIAALGKNLSTVLFDMRKVLAGTTAGRIASHGQNGPHYFASAHEVLTAATA